MSYTGSRDESPDLDRDRSRRHPAGPPSRWLRTDRLRSRLIATPGSIWDRSPTLVLRLFWAGVEFEMMRAARPALISAALPFRKHRKSAEPAQRLLNGSFADQAITSAGRFDCGYTG